MNIQGKYIKYEDYVALEEKCADLSERLNLICDLMEYAQRTFMLEQKKKRKLVQQRNTLSDDTKQDAHIAMLLAILEAAEHRIAETDQRNAELTARIEPMDRRIAELEARTVILPEPISVLHRRDFTDAHREIYAYPEAEVNAALADAGIKVKES